MKLMPIFATALVSTVGFVSAACVAAEPAASSKEKPPANEPEKDQTSSLTDLDEEAKSLREAFNEDAGKTRLILLVSPLCPMCRLGAHVVQEKALEQIESDKLKIYVVWLPRFPGDSRQVAEKAVALVSDKRARHFWDGAGSLGTRYGSIVDLPGEQDFAWDVYFSFGPKTRWSDEAPPTPDFWMHQLGPDTKERPRLNGEKLRKAVAALLPE